MADECHYCYDGVSSAGSSLLAEDRRCYSLVVISYPFRAPVGVLSFRGEGLITLVAWAESTRLPLLMSYVHRGVHLGVLLVVVVGVLAGDRARVLF